MTDRARVVTLDLLGRVLLDLQVEQREQRLELEEHRAELREQRMKLSVQREELGEKELQLREQQSDLSEQRAELRELRSLLLAQADQRHRVERRMSELKDDLELSLKTELMRRVEHIRTKVERHRPRAAGHHSASRAAAYLVACRKVVGKYARSSSSSEPGPSGP